MARAGKQNVSDRKTGVLYVGTEWADAISRSLEAARPRLTVHTVPDAATAQSDHETTAFDCVVSEYVLPDGRGTDLLSTVAGEPESPSVLLASEDARPTAAEAVSANLTEYFLVERLDERYAALGESIESAVGGPTGSRRERLQAALGLADAGAWEYDLASETLWWSERAREIHGDAPERTLPLDEFVGLYAPEDRRKIGDAFDIAVSQAEPFDETAKFDADADRWIRIRGEPVLDDGELDSIRGSCQDVTDLKRRQEQFRVLHSAGTQLVQATSREEAARITIDAAKNILGYVNAALRLVGGNEDVLRVFATTEDNVAVAGERPDYRVDEDVPAARVYRRGQPKVFSDLDLTQDDYRRGELRSGLYVPVGDHGVFSCGNSEADAYDRTDIDHVDVLAKLTAAALTRIEADRELRRKKDQLEGFSSVVAHDLRNPLNVAAGRLELAREEPQDAHFDPIENALERMEGIIDDLLALARAGESIDELAPVSLSEVAHEACKHARTDGLELTVADDIRITADRERLLHVFENLFRNALDHNDPPVSLTVGSLDEAQTSGGTSIAGFFVEDDGTGIPPQEREEVFEHGYTTCDDGTGFGLWIVRHVADAHGWNVEITDGRSGGARFNFTNVDLASETATQ